MNILNDELKKLNFDKIFIISDDLVFSVWEKTITNQLKSFEYDIILFKNWEKSKNIDTYIKICSELFSKWATSKSLIIAFWWWVVWNLAWFISSTLYRWIKFIHIPTTVLSQADSVYWWKQAINFEWRKNIIWSIYEPEFILVDYNFLSTLPEREIKCGIAESIKHALCEDIYFLDEFEKVSFDSENIIRIIENTINIKLRLLDMHSKDKKSWKIMKYWHTLWHALESILDWEITHWEWVSIGMCFIAYLMNKKWLISEKDKNIHLNILKKWWLPTKIPSNLDSSLIIKQIEKDNSFKNNKISLIVLTKIWDIFSQNSFILEVEKNEFEKILNDFISNL